MSLLAPGDLAFAGSTNDGPNFPVYPAYDTCMEVIGERIVFSVRSGSLVTIIGSLAPGVDRVFIMARDRLGWMWPGHLLRLTPELADRLVGAKRMSPGDLVVLAQDKERHQ